MTTETSKAADTKGDTAKDEEQNLLPTVLAGAGILVVAALLIFWPSDDDKGGSADGKAAASGSGKGEAAGGGAAGRAAGVGARSIDAPTTPEGRGTRNPAIKLPAGGRGMAPVPEATPTDPPPTASTADKIAFYEKRLEQAIRVRDTRKQFVDRLPEMQSRIEQSKDPDAGMKTFEKRKAIVEDNYAKAQADVDDIEKKLAALRGN